MITDHPWYFIILCLALGVGYAAAMYFVGRHSSFGTRLRWLLAALRTLAVSTIAFLLLSPTVRRIVNERQAPLIVLAHDVSTSVTTTMLSTEAGGYALDELHRMLSGDSRLLYTSNRDNPNQTNLGALLDIPRDAAAVVLATDGIYNRGLNPISVAERLAVPIFTIAYGDTTIDCDASLSHLRANRIAYAGSELTVEVNVTATKLDGQTTLLRITGNNSSTTLAQQELTYRGNHFSNTYTLTLPIGDQTGLRRYDLWLNKLPDETPLDNNHITFYVDVLDIRQQVAIVGAAPHPDLSALKQAIESNPNYEATILLANDLLKPKSKNQPTDFSLAILHNLPTSTIAVPDALKEMPQIHVVGLQTDLPRFNAMKSGLEIATRVKKSTDFTAVYNPAFSLFHLDRSDAEALEQLPPLTAPFGDAKPSEGLQNLLTARLGNIDTRQPLVAATSQGGRRRAFIWGEGLWRWRLNDYLNNQSHNHFDRFISQLVNFTAQDEGRERFHVESERIYQEGESVTLSAQLYNEAYEPVNSPEATLALKGDSISGDYPFSRSGNGYALNLGSLPAGTYRYHASTSLDGQTLTADGTFAVEQQNLEEANLTANHALLRTISSLTGGRTFYPDQIEELATALRDIKPVIHTHRRHSPLLGMPLVLGLILLLLSAEWILRKYHGEI